LVVALSQYQQSHCLEDTNEFYCSTEVALKKLTTLQ